MGKGKFSFAMVSFVEEEARREAAMGAMRDAAGRAVRRSAGANMVYIQVYDGDAMRWRWRWASMQMRKADSQMLLGDRRGD